MLLLKYGGINIKALPPLLSSVFNNFFVGCTIIFFTILQGAFSMPNLFGFDKMNKEQLLKEIRNRAQMLYQAYLQAETAYNATIDDIELRRSSSIENIFRQHRQEIEIIKSEHNKSYKEITERSKKLEENLSISNLPWGHEAWENYDTSSITQASKTMRIGTLSLQGKYGTFKTPAIIPIIGGGKNILIEAKGSGKDTARKAIQSIVLRILAVVPPGKLRLICIDPVGLGETVAGFIQDLPDTITQGKAWTEPNHIEQQLANLEQDMATIKTKYLGKRYSNIEEYNKDAGIVEEPYRLLVISDFPARFSDFAAQRLVSIATNGPAIGVYVLAMVDMETKLPYNFNLNDLERTSHLIVCDSSFSRWKDHNLEKCILNFDYPPGKEKFIQLVKQISDATKNLAKVEVLFKEGVDDQSRWWTGEASSEVRFPIGQLGAKKYQYMSINGDQEPDALIIGKVGYGKSNLLQVMIDSLITRYSPQEVSLYLLDLKQVTFEVYAVNRIPHARVIAIKAEIEFALSVLRRLEEELKYRKNIFTNIGELDLAGYRRSSGESLPRVFLFIDEFQDLFYDDQTAHTAENILENLVREGRSFGIHVVLASQTLRGQHTLPNVIKDLIPIRIALQCADADARLILSDDNSEAFLLERPGEAIYNNLNGRVEGNNRFQSFWLDKEERKTLIKTVVSYGNERGILQNPEQIIFDGRENVELMTNPDIINLLKKYPPIKNLENHLAWVGAPIEIKPHTKVVFRRSAGKNLIISGIDNSGSTILALASSILISLATQYSKDSAQYIIINFNELEQSNDHLTSLAKLLDIKAQVLNTQRDAENIFQELFLNLNERERAENSNLFPDCYLIILGLQKLRNLRSEKMAEDGQETLSSLLFNVCSRGPELGIFTIAQCDNLKNFERCLGRSGLDNFDLRVGLQMSADDSRALFENDKASELGSQRGFFLDINNQNSPEKFRPYNLPQVDFLDKLINKYEAGSL